jgi:hypothetical protein
VLGTATDAGVDDMNEAVAAAHLRAVGDIENFADGAAPFMHKDVAAAAAAAELAGSYIAFLRSVVASGPMDLI